ncbi:pantetheine-phosphate adenylyltransferase [Candidatus Woesearchaeota archaeon]|nr:pantetheine-phosphate adenylyltransferase [Candidatus Woesearchaeota archaeon]
MKTAIYAFSGDPITFGHIDIIRRASGVFDRLIVAIGENPSKNYLFSLDERLDMAKKSLLEFSNVAVCSFSGLLVDFAYENNVDIIVKGVRNSVDFNYENVLHQVGESQKLGIDTYILFARPELSHISSSIVKSIQKEQGLIHDYVPLYVKQKLEEKLSNQLIIGVTGEIGSGKSYFCDKILELGIKNDVLVHNVDLDKITHEILSSLQEPRYRKLRNDLVLVFGKNIENSDGSINRKNLGEIVFNDSFAMTKLNEMMYVPLLIRLKRALKGKTGIILLNAALLVESKLLHLCNNNIILLKVAENIQKERLYKRKLSDEQIERRLNSQFCFDEKKQIIDTLISSEKQGKLIVFDNDVASIDYFNMFFEDYFLRKTF